MIAILGLFEEVLSTARVTQRLIVGWLKKKCKKNSLTYLRYYSNQFVKRICDNIQSNTFDFRTEIHIQDLQIRNRAWHLFKAVGHMIKHAKIGKKYFTYCIIVLFTFDVIDSLLLNFVNKTSLMQFVRYLLYPSQLYMFRMSIPSILRSTGMYRREGTIYVRM